jgi:hypothetical protein
MKKIAKKIDILATSIAMTLIASPFSPAQAQLEEVIVTAQKRSESANDVGITMNAFSGNTIKDLGVYSAEDIASLTPGLVVIDGGYGAPVYAIRGVGFQDNVTVASSSTVGLYFDEISIPYAVMIKLPHCLEGQISMLYSDIAPQAPCGGPQLQGNRGGTLARSGGAPTVPRKPACQ